MSFRDKLKNFGSKLLGGSEKPDTLDSELASKSVKAEVAGVTGQDIIDLSQLSEYAVSQFMKRRNVNTLGRANDGRIQEFLDGDKSTFYELEICISLYQGVNIDKKHLGQMQAKGYPKTIEGFRMFCRAKERYWSKQANDVPHYKDFKW